MAASTQVIDRKSGQPIAIEPFRGKFGIHGIAIATPDGAVFVAKKDDTWDSFLKDLIEQAPMVACFDMRRILDFPIAGRLIRDVKMEFDTQTILATARQHLKDKELFSALQDDEQRISAAIRSAKTAQIDLNTVPVARVIPADLWESWLRNRARTILQLAQQEGPYSDEFEEHYDLICALHDVELNGIHVDMEVVERGLVETKNTSDAACLRSMKSLQHGGFVSSLFNPLGGKTGRVRIDGGFNSMAIPKDGFSRSAITSRFPEGSIYTFDFNAIDYRCIVTSIGGEFAELYRGCTDFHERTTRFVFKQPDPERDRVRRDAIKFISYVYIYGGSDETAAERSGMSLPMAKLVLRELDKHIGPIKEFRENLARFARDHGYIVMPNGVEIKAIESDGTVMHEGKLIGLYAQTFSSQVFERAFVRAHKLLQTTQSVIIFPVHDELVIDMHPDDEAAGVPERIRELLQGPGGNFAVKVKKGKSYAEAK